MYIIHYEIDIYPLMFLCQLVYSFFIWNILFFSSCQSKWYIALIKLNYMQLHCTNAKNTGGLVTQWIDHCTIIIMYECTHKSHKKLTWSLNKEILHPQYHLATPPACQVVSCPNTYDETVYVILEAKDSQTSWRIALCKIQYSLPRTKFNAV